MVTEVKQLHPTINPQQVDYVFQSIRFAWGKIKSVRPPKPPNPFPIAKRPIARRASNTQYPITHSQSPIAKRAPPKTAGIFFYKKNLRMSFFFRTFAADCCELSFFAIIPHQNPDY
jgi:hypothetical protein